MYSSTDTRLRRVEVEKSAVRASEGQAGGETRKKHLNTSIPDKRRHRAIELVVEVSLFLWRLLSVEDLLYDAPALLGIAEGPQFSPPRTICA